MTSKRFDPDLYPVTTILHWSGYWLAFNCDPWAIPHDEKGRVHPDWLDEHTDEYGTGLNPQAAVEDLTIMLKNRPLVVTARDEWLPLQLEQGIAVAEDPHGNPPQYRIVQQDNGRYMHIRGTIKIPGPIRPKDYIDLFTLPKEERIAGRDLISYTPGVGLHFRTSKSEGGYGLAEIITRDGLVTLARFDSGGASPIRFILNGFLIRLWERS